MDIVLPTSPELAYELFFTNKEFLSKFLNENQGVKGSLQYLGGPVA